MINYQLSVSNYVDLTIYDLLGKKVATLVSQTQSAGQHQVQWDAAGMPSGIYYYQITAGEFISMKKMVLVK